MEEMLSMMNGWMDECAYVYEVCMRVTERDRIGSVGDEHGT